MTSIDPSINIDQAQAEALRIGVEYGRMVASALEQSEHFSFNGQEKDLLRQSLNGPIRMAMDFLMDDNDFPLVVRSESLNQALMDQDGAGVLVHWKTEIETRVQVRQQKMHEELLEQQIMIEKMSMSYLRENDDDDLEKERETKWLMIRKKQRQDIQDQQFKGGQYISLDSQNLLAAHRIGFGHIVARARQYLQEFGKAVNMDPDAIVIEDPAVTMEPPTIQAQTVSAKRSTPHLFSPPGKNFL